MKKILLMMKRKSFAQSLARILAESQEYSIEIISDYSQSEFYILNMSINMVMIEMAQSGDYGYEYCIELCKRLKKDFPECRRMIMCPEGDGKISDAVINAKKSGDIDDFIFYDVSLNDLLIRIKSLA
jgi:PleD family two-component response regulator